MTNARAGINTHYIGGTLISTQVAAYHEARGLIGSPGIDFSLMETETHTKIMGVTSREELNKLCASHTHTSSLGEPNEPFRCVFSFSVFHCGGIDCAWC
jgi:hypothetical protein